MAKKNEKKETKSEEYMDMCISLGVMFGTVGAFILSLCVKNADSIKYLAYGSILGLVLGSLAGYIVLVIKKNNK